MDHPFDRYQCPRCGYLISVIEMQYARFDYGCPNRIRISCGRTIKCLTPFSDFDFKQGYRTREPVD